MLPRYRSVVLFVFAIAIAVYAAYTARDVLLLIYFSALSAVVIMPVVEAVRQIRIGRWRPGRGQAMAMIVVPALAALALLSTLAIPPFADELQQLAASPRQPFQTLLERFNRIPYANELAHHVDLTSLQQYATSLMGGMLGLVRNLVSGAVTVGSWIILTAYFLVDGETAFEWVCSFFPPPQRARFEATSHRANARARRWLVGQGLLMLTLGLSATIVFGLLGVKYFYALGVLTGLANIVPIVGPITMITLSSVIAAIDSTGKLVGVLIFYLVYQQVESIFLTPRIMESTVKLPPLAVVIVLILGAWLGGALGALMSVPTAALASVFVDEYLVYHGAPITPS